MFVIYDSGVYKIKLNETELILYNNKQPLLCPNFLDNYVLYTDGFFYPNIVINATLKRVFMNDNYKEFSYNNDNFIAIKTSYKINNILYDNNWFIDIQGKIRLLPIKTNNFYIYKQDNCYTGGYVTNITESYDNVFPYKNTQLILAGETQPIAKLRNYFSFIIDTSNNKTSQIIFNGVYDNGEFIPNE